MTKNYRFDVPAHLQQGPPPKQPATGLTAAARNLADPERVYYYPQPDIRGLSTVNLDCEREMLQRHYGI